MVVGRYVCGYGYVFDDGRYVFVLEGLKYEKLNNFLKVVKFGFGYDVGDVE